MEPHIELDNRSPLEKFDDAIKILSDECGKKLNDKTINHYYLSLNKHHIDTVCHIIRTWTFNKPRCKFPNIGEILAAVKNNSSREYAKHQDEDLDKKRKLEELEKEYTLICKQICANQPNMQFMNHPIMRKLMAKNSEVVKQLNRDYNAYKTELTNVQLYDKLNEVRRKLSNID